ncbi:hypothetical protein [Flavobacterium sp.]|uniref:hypothetical protein n=2 Tax=Flavobacterium sp. TaxID=239 RepID=UPI00404765A9
MQKMIFSAIALIAFSFAGMANEIEEKKVEDFYFETSNIKIKEVQKPIIVMGYCEGLYLWVKEKVLQTFDDEDIASEIAFAAMKRCQELI